MLENKERWREPGQNDLERGPLSPAQPPLKKKRNSRKYVGNEGTCRRTEKETNIAKEYKGGLGAYAGSASDERNLLENRKQARNLKM